MAARATKTSTTIAAVSWTGGTREYASFSTRPAAGPGTASVRATTSAAAARHGPGRRAFTGAQAGATAAVVLFIDGQESNVSPRPHIRRE